VPIRIFSALSNVSFANKMYEAFWCCQLCILTLLPAVIAHFGSKRSNSIVARFASTLLELQLIMTISRNASTLLNLLSVESLVSSCHYQFNTANKLFHPLELLW